MSIADASVNWAGFLTWLRGDQTPVGSDFYSFNYTPAKIPMPPPVSAASIVSASSVPDTNLQITQEIQAWQAQNQNFFNSLALAEGSNVGDGLGGSYNWWLIGGAALLGIVGIKYLL